MKTIVMLMVALALVACGQDEHQDIKAWMKESAKDLRGQVLPTPQIKPFPLVSYNATDTVDPFKPTKIEPEKRASKVGIKGPPELDPQAHPLIKFPLESLRFTGALRQRGTVRGIIIADRTVYQVSVGTYMGQNFGVVTGIDVSDAMDEGSILLKELVQDATGDWVERTVTLVMQVQEGRK